VFPSPTTTHDHGRSQLPPLELVEYLTREGEPPALDLLGKTSENILALLDWNQASDLRYGTRIDNPYLLQHASSSTRAKIPVPTPKS
jgi:hypothetical protein